MNKYHIPNLDKACQVIELVSQSPAGRSLKQISSELEIPRTTALRIVETMLSRNFLARNEEGLFTPGTALVRLGVMALDNLDIRSFARPVLKKLTQETGESCHLAVLNGDKSMLVEVADNPHPVRIAARPGTLVDLHCSATGKIFLAFSVPDPRTFCETLDLPPHTANTDATPAAVLKSIEQTREQGFAMDEEEYVPGVRCIAAPVQNAFGKTIAAVGLTASTATFTKTKTPAIADKIKKAAAEISSNLSR